MLRVSYRYLKLNLFRMSSRNFSARQKNLNRKASNHLGTSLSFLKKPQGKASDHINPELFPACCYFILPLLNSHHHHFSQRTLRRQTEMCVWFKRKFMLHELSSSDKKNRRKLKWNETSRFSLHPRTFFSCFIAEHLSFRKLRMP